MFGLSPSLDLGSVNHGAPSAAVTDGRSASITMTSLQFTSSFYRLLAYNSCLTQLWWLEKQYLLANRLTANV